MGLNTRFETAGETLIDNSGGTASDTIAALTADATVKDAIASLTAQVNLLTAAVNSGEG